MKNTIEQINEKYSRQFMFEVGSATHCLVLGERPVIEFIGDFEDHLAFHNAVMLHAKNNFKHLYNDNF